MLAKIDVSGVDESGKVTVTLRGGRGLTAELLADEIAVRENSTGLDARVAEHLAGIAWAMAKDEDAVTVPWRRLLARANRSLKEFEAARLKTN
jgi:hypothetical protein